MRFGLRDSGCDLIERDAWRSSVTSRDWSLLLARIESMKRRFGFLAVALLTNAARLCGQTIQSQLGVAWWLTVPTGAYHSGDLGGFKAGSQAMRLVNTRARRAPGQCAGRRHVRRKRRGRPIQDHLPDMAWNLGAGIKIGGSVTALFIETRYLHVAGGLGYSCPLRTSCPRQSGSPTTFVPITAVFGSVADVARCVRVRVCL